MSLETAMQQAVEHHRAGRLQQAENLYRAVLQVRPGHPDANHNLGLIAAQAGQHEAALRLFKIAYTALPSHEQFIQSYASTLQVCGYQEDAQAVLQRTRQQGSHMPAPLSHQDAQRLVDLFNAGQYTALETEAGALLRTQPESGFLWKTLGASLQKLGKEALPALRRAADLLPGDADAQNNLAVVLNLAGKHREAVAYSRKAVQLASGFFAAHCSLGDGLYALNDLNAAATSYRAALQIRQDFNVHINLGIVLRDLGLAEPALESFTKAAEMNPSSAIPHTYVGLVLQQAQRWQEAEASYRNALHLDPRFVMAQNGLGNVLLAQKRHNEACNCYRQALAVDPKHADSHNNLGVALRELGRHAAAVTSFEHAIACKADFAEAHSNLGNILLDLGRMEDALASCTRATHINPGLAMAHSLLGHVLHALRRYDDAKTSLLRALALQPDLAETHNNLGALLRDMGDLDGAVASCERALALNPAMFDAHSNLLFSGNYLTHRPAAALMTDARRYGTVAMQAARPYTAWANPPLAERRLRVGLVSGDMGIHPVGFFLEQVLVQLHAQFSQEVALVAYANSLQSDMLTERLRACCVQWRTVVGMSDEQLAGQVHADEIDILIDLSGHTTANRLSMFAWKPAPVQVSWLGYFASTGLAAIDYLVADPWTLPTREETNFTEKIWRLPETRLCFTAPAEIAVNPLPALKNGYLTFGCFNNISKINDEVLALWSAILRALPDSRLILKAKQFSEPSARDLMLRRFAAHGIEFSRLELLGPSSRTEYLHSYGRLDIALDPFPVTGATTTAEALWMGVPVLSMAGERFVSRQGIGLLMNAGLPEWVAQDADDYLVRAISHAGDLHRLATLRAGLREQVLASPVFDARRFTTHFAAMLRDMWQIWCKQAGATRAKKNKSTAASPTQQIDQLIALFHAGRFADLERAAQRILERRPYSGFTWKALGAALQVLGKNSLPALRRAVELLPDDAQARNNLGLALMERGRLDESVACYRRALEIAPGMVEAHSNLGNALQALGRAEESAASCRVALQLRPDFAEAYCNLGNALRDLGQFDEAVANCRSALQLKPDMAPALINLGNALRDLKRHDEAMTHYLRALPLAPDNTDLLHNIGVNLFDQCRYEAALARHRQVQQLDPAYPDIHSDLANAYRELGRHQEALDCYRLALARKPEAMTTLGDMLFTQSYLTQSRAAHDLADAKRYGELAARRARSYVNWNCPRDPERLLRIGFVSGDLLRHPVGYFIEGVFAALAAGASGRLQLTAYPTRESDDEVSHGIRSCCHAWHPAHAMTDEELAAQIHQDGIDILFDLSGHTKYNRLPTFAWKPAPIQVSWLGYFATTGVATVDYMLVDPLTVAPDEQARFTEKLRYLPETRLCFTAPRIDHALDAVVPLPALNNAYITFGCFNNLSKMNDEVVALWAAILQAVPGSRLFLKSRQFDEIQSHQTVQQRFATHAIPAERLLLEGHTAREHYLLSYHKVDIALDPFPYTGATTTAEALWMGVPVLTLMGERLVARQGTSLLSNAGLPDWVAHSQEEYLQLAVSHAARLEHLAALRLRLREQVTTSPIFDAPRFAVHFEAALRDMWREWCNKQ